LPTYQYECDACGHAFEILQSMLDMKLQECPACGQNSLQRLIGAGSGIIFKGSGFYETDYKKKGPSGKASADSSPGTSVKTDEPKTEKGADFGEKTSKEKADQSAG